MKQYLDQLRHVLENGETQSDRTGVGTVSVFGLQTRYHMPDGFPAVTTKKLAWKSMVSELLWLISGSDNILDLKAIYPHNKLWDANQQDFARRIEDPERKRWAEEGWMGDVYGVKWREWETRGFIGSPPVDQLAEAICTIRTNPTSRRNIVTAWDPQAVGIQDVALPPCHCFYQFRVSGEKLSLMMYQRSCDMLLGVPLNVASYSLLLHMVAMVTGLIPWDFVHTMADAHVYLNHTEAVSEQLSRKPYPLPCLVIKDRQQTEIDDFHMDDFSLKGYEHHPAIRAEMAV